MKKYNFIARTPRYNNNNEYTNWTGLVTFEADSITVETEGMTTIIPTYDQFNKFAKHNNIKYGEEVIES